MQLRFSGRLNLTHATLSTTSKATVSFSARSCAIALLLFESPCVRRSVRSGSARARVSTVIHRSSVNASIPALPPKRP